MLAIETLKQRIADQVPALVSVRELADLIAAKGIVSRAPACFVAPGQESADRSPMIGRVSQRVNETFSLWLAIDNGASATGSRALQELQQLVASVRASLVGWRPSPDFLPIELVSGGPIQWDSGETIFWPEQYRTEYYLEN